MNVKTKVTCPVCDLRAKKVKQTKYPDETWYYCTNPSCNKTVFQVS